MERIERVIYVHPTLDCELIQNNLDGKSCGGTDIKWSVTLFANGNKNETKEFVDEISALHEARGIMKTGYLGQDDRWQIMNEGATTIFKTIK